MKSKILFGISLLFGLMMLQSGLNKFFNFMPMEMPEAAAKVIASFIESNWLWPLVAIIEIVGGILFIIPKFRALGAIIIFPITVGIVLFNAVWTPSLLPVAIVLFAINSWVILENKAKYMPMISA